MCTYGPQAFETDLRARFISVTAVSVQGRRQAQQPRSVCGVPVPRVSCRFLQDIGHTVSYKVDIMVLDILRICVHKGSMCAY